MAMSRDGILAVDDIQVEKVPVPEWHDEVIVRGLTGEERDAYEASRRRIINAGTPKAEMILVSDNARANLLVKCIVDENHERLFTDQDAGLLGMKNARALERLHDVAARLSGLSDEAADEIEGNSEAAPSGASTTSSPETSDAPFVSSSDGSPAES